MGDAGGVEVGGICRKGVELVKNRGWGKFLESHEEMGTGRDASSMLRLCFVE